MPTSPWRRLWFALRNAFMRVRFMTGKASFVEADIEMTTNNVAEVYDPAGGRSDQRLLAHYRLTTRRPVMGSGGWRLFEERLLSPVGHRTVLLRCGYCSHHFVVQVLSKLDPLASDTTGGRPPARPASYTADWFRFMHADYEGTPSLRCPRCEQNSEPLVEPLEPA